MVSPTSVDIPPLANDAWSLAAPFAAELGVDHLLASQYYELRLARGSEQVDYLVAFYSDRAASLRDSVAARIEQEPAYQTAGWRAIDRLLRDWASGASLSARRTPCVWFELDDFAHQPLGAVPSLSVCLTPAYRIDEPPPHTTRDDLSHARQVLEILEAPADAGIGLNDVFAALPSDARWIHLSYMLGRAQPAVKLYGVMRRDELIRYLERIGWKGRLGDVAMALRRLYPAEHLGDELYLDLNLDDLRDPRRCTLGLAVAQQHLLRGNDDDPVRTSILQAWEAAGLCDAGKVRQVQAWPSSADGKRQHPFLRDVRYLDVKLVWSASSGWQAKAYLGRQLQRGLF